jgi:hypothetical protein
VSLEESVMVQYSNGKDKDKGSKGRIGIEVTVPTLVLSSLVYLFFYVETPIAPLNPAEVTVTVGVCLVSTLIIRYLWNRIQKKPKK